MPQRLAASTQNNFTKGLVTEFTGLNFPENAATDCDNVDFDVTGNVKRRQGFKFETNAVAESLDPRINYAINTYKWNNAGGDGTVQIVAVQDGATLYFYDSTAATELDPLTNQKLASSVSISSFTAFGGTFDASKEAQFADGNGFLFVYHPDCEPFYVTYEAGTLTGHAIFVQIRDFAGVPEPGVADNTRPSSLTDSHNYNLQNQGWTSGNPWSATSTSSVSIGVGAKVFTVAAGIGGIVPAQTVIVRTVGVPNSYYMVGTVTSYAGTTLTLSIASVSGLGSFSNWIITPVDSGYINTWFTAVGNYPSNADQWWRFKNASGVFDPATTQANTSFGLGAAPKGHFILNAFDQRRGGVSGVSNITDISTTARPTNGTWFQGRVWYTGINASNPATGTAPFTTWTEDIYFSQVVVKTEDFGKCYQTNDPTSELLFDLLPTDGGVIKIQGCGPVYRLFPYQNGLLVFAANGIWYITGSQGIGFSAVDYTVTKISSVPSLSTSSFVDVMGLPYFWNEDGIYAVQPQQGGGLAVNSMTYSTIGLFYDGIPLDSKRYARGAYNPITYIIQWVYKSEEETSVTDRYNFDKILNYNVYNKAFFPYTVGADAENDSVINGVNFVQSPGGSGAPASTFKYFATAKSILAGSYDLFGFVDETGSNYLEWNNDDYVSYVVTGYSLRGDAMRKFQNQYLQIWSNLDEVESGYKIQGIWDYSTSGNSGRWSTIQNIDLDADDNYSSVYRRHKIRGSGYSLQFKMISQTGKNFNFSGWASVDSVNQGT